MQSVVNNIEAGRKASKLLIFSLFFVFLLAAHFMASAPHPSHRHKKKKVVIGIFVRIITIAVLLPNIIQKTS